MSDQKKINDFVRQHVDKGQVIHWNSLKFTGTSKEHQDMVYNICWYLYQHDIPFATEVSFKSKYNPDIICPTWIKPIIEVRHSENDKRTLEKFVRIPNELSNQIIYVDSTKAFVDWMIQ